tara:strand:+ start:481 stop:1497 length:1017 start_codon:yes stop_codon:yes gene_type:complete
VKILIVKFGALGDVVRTSYFLPGLLKKYPGAEIFWYTSKLSLDLLSSNKYITKLFTNEDTYDVLGSESFDYVISLDDEREILETLYDYSIRVDVGAYINDDSIVTYTDNSAQWFDMGLLSKFGKIEADRLKKTNKREHNEIFAEILDIDISKPYFFGDTTKDIEHFELSSSDYNIGLNPGAGGRWVGKRLLKNEAVRLINELEKKIINKKKVKVFLLGGKTEHDFNNAILKDCNFLAIDTGADNTLKEFAKIISMMDLVITSDSLALHLAIAQGIKSLSFFAPTSSAEIGLFDNGVKVESLSEDYCSYVSDADNSSITSKRLLDALSSLDKINIEELV